MTRKLPSRAKLPIQLAVILGSVCLAPPLLGADRVLYQEDFNDGQAGQSFQAASDWTTNDKGCDLLLAEGRSGNLYVDGSTNVPESKGVSSNPFFSVRLRQAPIPGAGNYLVLEAELRGGPGAQPKLTSTINSSLWLTGSSPGYDGVIARWHYSSDLTHPPAPSWTFTTGGQAVAVGQKDEVLAQTDAVGMWVRAYIVVDLVGRTVQGMIRAGDQLIVSHAYQLAPQFDLWSNIHLVNRQDTRYGLYGLDLDNLQVRQSNDNPIPTEQRGEPIGPEVGVSAADVYVGEWAKPTGEVVSQHVSWLKPSATKPLRVLYVTSSRSLREIVELDERFDFERDVFTTVSQRDLSSSNARVQKMLPGISPGDTLTRLHSKLEKDYDVITVGNIYWQTLPDWGRKRILDKVAAGAGLVMFVRGPWPEDLQPILSRSIPLDGREVLSAFPHAGLPAYRGHATFEQFVDRTLLFARHGKGRVVLIRGRAPEGASSALWAARGVAEGIEVPDRQMLTPIVVDAFPKLNPIHYDYYLAQIGHLIRWASNAPRPVRVVQPTLSLTVAQRERWPLPVVAIQSDDQRKVTLVGALRHAALGNVIQQTEAQVTLAAGLNHTQVELDAPPAGRYFLDLWVKQNNAILDYGSAFLEVASASHLTHLALDIESFLVGQPVTGTVSATGGADIEIEQWDNLGRLVAKQRIPATRQSFNLVAPRPLTVLQRIDAKLLDAKSAVLDHRHLFLTVRNLFPPRDDIRAIVSQGSDDPSYLGIIHSRAMRRLGFDTRMTAGGWHVHSSEALEGTPLHRWVRPRRLVDRKFIHYGSALFANLYNLISIYDGVDGDYDWNVLPRGASTDGPHGPVRRPCLTNLGYQRKVFDFYSGEAKRLKFLGVPEYNLGDECTFLPSQENIDVCFSDTCIRGFQNYVREIYGSIDRLNEQYDANYADFSDVIPVPFPKALETGQVSLWIDHRRHMERNWSGYYQRAREAIEPNAPGALVGYEGSDDPGHMYAERIGGADDYYRLAKSMSMNGMYYYPLQLDCTRDFSEPGTMIGGGWFGGYASRWRAGRDAVHHCWWLWNGLLRGANAIWVYTGNALMQSDGYFSIVRSDFAPFEFFRKTAKHIHRAKSGIGKLIMASERPNDGIAVLYSPPSMLLSAFDEQMPQRWESPSSVAHVLTEAGFQYRMIYPTQLVDGVLSKGGFRMLYLPYCQAMSRAEIEAIRKFAKEGGIVFADLRPAVADEHGKPYETGALDDLFGVSQQTAKAQTVRAEVKATGGFANLPLSRGDGSLKLRGGTAHASIDETPAAIVNAYGSGAGILLNFAPSDFLVGNLSYDVSFTDDDTANAMRGIVHGLLGQQGIAPEITTDPQIPGFHVFRHGLGGGARLISLIWDAPAFLPGIRYSEDDKIEQAMQWEKTVMVRLPGGEARHVYRVFDGEYIGHTDAIEQTLHPGDVHLYAALPYKVGGIDVSVESGRELRWSAQVEGGQSLHMLRVELIGPDGEAIERYTANVTAPAGKAEGSFALALNDPSGTWRVRVRDMATGVVQVEPFEVATTTANASRRPKYSSR